MDRDTMLLVIVVGFVSAVVFLVAGTLILIGNWRKDRIAAPQPLPMPGIQAPQIDKHPTTPLDSLEAMPPLPMQEHLLFIQIAGYLRVERLRKGLEDYGQFTSETTED